MIQPEELRVGNLIYGRQKQMLCTCLSVVQKGCDVKVIRLNPYPADKDHFGFTFLEYDEMDSIPLTPEWLEANHVEGIMGYPLRKNAIRDGSGRYDGFIAVIPRGDSQGMKFILKVTYVHQLQNLIFALTSHELPVKENV